MPEIEIIDEDLLGQVTAGLVLEVVKRFAGAAQTLTGEAHLAEDQLYIALLKAIAEGRCDDPATCARIVLQTQDLNFPRWYS